MKNDQGCCGGICGLIVGIVVLIAVIGAVASILPSLASIAGIIVVALIIYYVVRRDREEEERKRQQRHQQQQQNNGAPGGWVWQQMPFGGRAPGDKASGAGVKKPVSPLKTSREIKVTISDVEASDKTETLKAILEETDGKNGGSAG